MSRNHLDHETSPYLLQHKDNPVHWRPWGPEALAEAKRLDRPILLSIGYAACHWCHVMAHESFEDDATARLMNELFVPIKVDREERPDLDHLYQGALALLGEQGGWPLTMFLTPAREPFWGGTYFPPESRYGRPAFRDVLASVAEIYRRQPEKIAANARSLTFALSRQASARPGSLPDPAARLDLARAVLPSLDPSQGGLAGAPKFPQAPLFEFLWHQGLAHRAPELTGPVLLLLEKLCTGGIYDHLGGGFARYATDPAWLVPHFEKMLYDNAQAIRLLTEAWQFSGRRLFARRVADTVDWLHREMLAESGAFAASQDADSEGHEGRAYVWTAGQIDKLLDPATARHFKRVYDVTPGGNWEGVAILNRNHPAAGDDDEEEEALAAARARLLGARLTRVQPARDDKILADWNGMMIGALARAALVFKRPDWLKIAEQAFEAVVTHLDRDGRLAHAYRQGRRSGPGILDDYAHMAEAALLLYESSGQAAYLEKAGLWAETAVLHFLDGEKGGFFLSSDQASDILIRAKTAGDGATPSGNAVMARMLARLYAHGGVERHRVLAESTILAFAGEDDRRALSMVALFDAIPLLEDPLHVVLPVDEDGIPDQAMMAVLTAQPLPNLVLGQVGGMRAGPAGPLADILPGLPPGAALFCRGQSCQPPLFSAARLAEALSHP